MLLLVTDGGVDAAVGCSSESCIGSQTFDIAGGPFAPVLGRLWLDPVGLTLSFDLWGESLLLAETVPGTEDNGVAEIEFADVVYAATDLPVSEGPAGSFSIDFDSVASLDGIQTEWDDAGVPVNTTPAEFVADPVLVTGNCFFVDPNNASCSLTFGTDGFALDVGDPLPQTRYFRHTMNLITVPEPGEIPLLVTAVAGLLLLGRKRIKA
jgi:hypothetical protein